MDRVSTATAAASSRPRAACPAPRIAARSASFGVRSPTSTLSYPAASVRRGWRHSTRGGAGRAVPGDHATATTVAVHDTRGRYAAADGGQQRTAARHCGRLVRRNRAGFVRVACTHGIVAAQRTAAFSHPTIDAFLTVSRRGWGDGVNRAAPSLACLTA